MCRSPPIAWTLAAHASHIMPGPLRGWRNESSSVLMISPLFFGFGFHSAFRIAVDSDRPLMRWAAQSAEMSLQLMPHTFSVYVLKKMLKSREPNLFVTHSSKLRGFL